MSNSEKYYRLTNKAEVHRGLQYHDGLNVDPVDFSPTGTSSAGGMYFFSREELAHFYRYVSVEDSYWIREVMLPPAARVHLEVGKRKADQFILGPRRKFSMDDSHFTPAEREMAVSYDGRYIQYIKIPEERLAVVKHYAHAIQFIENPTAEERLAAVKQNGWTIQFIKDPSADERLAAVKQNGSAIRWIKVPTAGERLAAVKNNGLAIQFIKDPTAEECLAAVNEVGHAIQFIEDPSSEERLAAVKKDGGAIKHISDPSAEERITAVKQDGYSINYIKDPTAEERLVAVKQNYCGRDSRI